MKPIVSIILPTYNGAQTLRRAVDSVTAQTYHDWELIVVCDGSTDNTKDIMASCCSLDPRIIFIENESNSGIQKTLNNGLKIARGEYVARIDDDDQWIDITKLAAQVDFMQKNLEYVLVGTDAIVADEQGRKLSVNIMPKTDEAIRSKILSKNCFLHSTIFVKRSVVQKVGGYSEKKENLHAEDYDLWLKMGTEGKMANLEMCSTLLTARTQGLTSRNRLVQAMHVRRLVFVYKKTYPHFLSGYIVSTLRVIFFCLLYVVPVPESLWYSMQRMYRSV